MDAPQYPSNIPIPDPSILTTEMLRRETKGLREILEVRIQGLEAAAKSERECAEHGLKVLRELYDQKITSVQRQFSERDDRFKQIKEISEKAAAAQDRAASQAIAKSETSVEKQLDSIRTLLTSTASALTDKIESINARLNRGEGIAKDRAATTATAIAVAGVIAMLVGGLLGFHFNNQTPNQPPQITFSAPPGSLIIPPSAKTTP